MTDPRDREPPQYGERVTPGASPSPDQSGSPQPGQSSYSQFARPTDPQPASAPGAVARRFSSAWVTWLLIAICVVVFLAQWATGLSTGIVTQESVFYGPLAISEPWRFVTSMFVHANILHIASNMFSLFIIGPQLERLIGHWRFAVLYFLSGFAGGVAVELLLPTTPTLGASGAIFGLLGAYFVIARRLGGNVSQIVIVIVINLAIGFYVPSIAWQAHVGGLIVGALVALVYARPRTERNPTGWNWMLVVIAVLLAVIAVVTRVLHGT